MLPYNSVKVLNFTAHMKVDAKTNSLRRNLRIIILIDNINVKIGLLMRSFFQIV